MKIHRPLAAATVENLMLIFNENQQADKVIENALKENKKWGARDRNFVAENTYDIIRWWRFLKFSAEINARKITGEKHYWKMLGAWFVLNGFVLPDWEEFKDLNAEDINKRSLEGKSIRKIRESVPDWLDEIGEKEVDNWDKELAALNNKADLFVRVNTLKTTKDNLIEMLKDEGLEVEAVPKVKSALHILKRKKLHNLSSFRKGFFEVQDAGSQLIGDFLEVKPGMYVIDACAGAGGKTLSLGTSMRNEGQLFAFDIHQKKLDELLKRATRNGIAIIQTQKINNETISKHEGLADRILLDVPCSGLGVLKRKPDAKWKLKPDFLESVKETQAYILEHYSSMLKPGGKLVYATCSILKSENQHQVNAFLAKNPNYTLEYEKTISPAETGFDGFYMARIIRYT